MKKIQFDYLCSEEWDKMSKNSCGKHCAVCDKTVLDLNSSSPLPEDKDNLCGRLQLKANSPYSKSIRIAASTAIALGLLSTESLQAQDSPPKDSTEYVIEKQDSVFRILEGRVSDHETDEYLPFVNVWYYNKNGAMHVTTTDFDGLFQLKVPEEHIGPAIDLHFRFLGYRDMEVVGIRLNDRITYMNPQLTKMESDLELLGYVVIIEEDDLFRMNFEKDFSGQIWGKEEIQCYPEC